jgi:hypothetical protein
MMLDANDSFIDHVRLRNIFKNFIYEQVEAQLKATFKMRILDLAVLIFLMIKRNFQTVTTPSWAGNFFSRNKGALSEKWHGGTLGEIDVRGFTSTAHEKAE